MQNSLSKKANCMLINYDVFNDILRYCEQNKLKKISLLSKEIYDIVHPLLIYRLVRFGTKEIEFHGTRKFAFTTDFKKIDEIKDCCKYFISYMLGYSEQIPDFICPNKVEILDLHKLERKDIFLLDEMTNYHNLMSNKLSQLRELYSFDCHLSRFPQDIYQLKYLKKLIINMGHFESLPEDIRKLEQLQLLDLSGGVLESLPETIVELKQLRILNLFHNRLTSLPETMGKITQLRELDLKDNQLTHLPDSMNQLKYLKELDVRNNKFITPLSDHLVQIIELGKLTFLHPIEKYTRRAQQQMRN